jgi:hypothetical protein
VHPTPWSEGRSEGPPEMTTNPSDFSCDVANRQSGDEIVRGLAVGFAQFRLLLADVLSAYPCLNHCVILLRCRQPTDCAPVFSCRGHRFGAHWGMSEALFESHAGRLRVRPDKAGKSRITNGSAFLPGIDGRSAWVRRAKDLMGDHLSDLGGSTNVSAGELSIVRRAAVITTELEHLETRFATAGSATADDLDLYLRASNNLRRLLEAVGLRRRPRNVTPTLTEYLDHIHQQQTTLDEEAAQ